MKIVKCQYNLVQLQRIGRKAKKLITFNIRSLFFTSDCSAGWNL